MFLSTCSLSACSLFTGSQYISDANPNSSNNLTANPFELKISDEFNDGKRLHVVGIVNVFTEWKSKDAVIRLSGLHNGEVLTESFIALDKLIEASLTKEIKTVSKGQQTFSLSISADGVSDYQVEVLWGADAKPYLDILTKEAPGELVIKNIQVETRQEACAGKNCGIKYHITAEMLNLGGLTVKNIVLGVGFIRVPVGAPIDLQREIPENEELLQLENIRLDAGKSRPLKLDFDQPVSEGMILSDEGTLKPVIRIVSFESDRN
jgi:hypothetical protein